MVDIFDEVDEDLRAERAQQFLKRHGRLLIALGLLIVAATVGWQGWRWRQAREDNTAATRYLTAMSDADRLRPGEVNRQKQVAQSFREFAAEAPAGYATLARLRGAALFADAGDVQSASALWDQVAGDTSVEPIWRDLASLNWVEQHIDRGDPALLEARLGPLMSESSPWRILALEVEGLLELRTGKTGKAHNAFKALAQESQAPEGVQGRATALSSRLGG